MPILRIFLLSCSIVFFSLAGVPLAAEQVKAQKTPHELIDELLRYMRGRRGMEHTSYFRLNRFVEEEKKTAIAISELVSSGQSTALIAKNPSGNTPLMSAASLGYSEVVRELLKHATVRSEIDATNSVGLSAWTYANIALRRTEWVCDPSVLYDLNSVYSLPYQPYYEQPGENPYTKTKRLLEKAGAKTNLEQAKQYWLKICNKQDEKVREKVLNTNDLLATVLAESADILKNFRDDRRRIMQICPFGKDRPRAREMWLNAPKTTEALLRVIKAFMDDPNMDGFDFGEKILGFAREDWGRPGEFANGHGRWRREYIPFGIEWALMRPDGKWGEGPRGKGKLPPWPTPYYLDATESSIAIDDNDNLLHVQIDMLPDYVMANPFCLSPIQTKDILGEPKTVSGNQDLLSLSYEVVHGEKVYRIHFQYFGNATNEDDSRIFEANKSEFSKRIEEHKGHCVGSVAVWQI